MAKNILMILLTIALAGCRSSVLDDPSTTIGYSIPQNSHVKLTVENNYNTVVATLVDADLAAGRYSSSFDASGLLEGVYYYTLECKDEAHSYYYKKTQYLLMIK